MAEGSETVVARRSVLLRALSLDALRGLAILGMVLSSMVPYFHNTLPAWMYHAQTPPPTHRYDAALSGMTWVDLVFPLFLFALGAAIPLALHSRLEAGASRWQIARGVIFRGALLLFFAVYKQHLSPSMLTEIYGDWGYGISILAFVLLFAIFTRFPGGWPGWLKWILRISGWLAVATLLAYVQYPDGRGFSVHRHDIIIVILANVAVGTTLVYLMTGGRASPKICAMGMVTTLVLARRFAPWGIPVTELYFLKPLLGDRIYEGIIWGISPGYQQYLLITIPGLIAGDILSGWIRPESQRLSFSIQHSRWRQLSLLRCLCLAVVCVAVVVLCITGFTLHDLRLTVILSACLSALGLVLLYSPPARERLKLTPGLRGQPRVSALLFRKLFLWGVVWLALGFALYGDQGGMRKDPPTFSYMFASAGLAHMLLIAFAVITDALHRPGLLFPVIHNGQNPMIAYVIGSMLVVPVMQLIPVGEASLLEWLGSMTASPWAGFGRGVGLTLLVALLVAAMTRLKIFWRT